MNIPTVTLYSERGPAIVNESDVPVLLAAGWSLTPPPDPEPSPDKKAKKGKA